MAAQGKYKQVNICKLKVLGKGWLLPNIQSRKHLAFAAPEGEEKMLSKSLLVLCKVSSVRRLNAESQVSWTLPSVILRRLRAIRPCPHHFNTLCIPLLGILAEDEALYVLFYAVSKYRVTAKDAASILRELMYTCTS